MALCREGAIMKFRNLLWITLVLVLFGCASGAKFTTSEPPSTDSARLYVFRPSSAPILYKPTISINGTEIAELANKGYLDIELKPGTYTVESRWSVLSGVVGRTTKIQLEAKTGDIYYVLVSTTANVYGMYTPGVQKSITQIVGAEYAAPLIKECGLVERYGGVEKPITPR